MGLYFEIKFTEISLIVQADHFLCDQNIKYKMVLLTWRLEETQGRLFILAEVSGFECVVTLQNVTVNNHNNSG